MYNRFNTTFYYGTLILNIRHLRQNKYGQIFLNYKRFSSSYTMRNEYQAGDVLGVLFQYAGILLHMHIDNEREMTCTKT